MCWLDWRRWLSSSWRGWTRGWWARYRRKACTGFGGRGWWHMSNREEGAHWCGRPLGGLSQHWHQRGDTSPSSNEHLHKFLLRQEFGKVKVKGWYSRVIQKEQRGFGWNRTLQEANLTLGSGPFWRVNFPAGALSSRLWPSWTDHQHVIISSLLVYRWRKYTSIWSCRNWETRPPSSRFTVIRYWREENVIYRRGDNNVEPKLNKKLPHLWSGLSGCSSSPAFFCNIQ